MGDCRKYGDENFKILGNEDTHHLEGSSKCAGFLSEPSSCMEGLNEKRHLDLNPEMPRADNKEPGSSSSPRGSRLQVPGDESCGIGILRNAYRAQGRSLLLRHVNAAMNERAML